MKFYWHIYHIPHIHSPFFASIYSFTHSPHSPIHLIHPFTHSPHSPIHLIHPLKMILCPLDFSAASPALVTYAAALALATGAELRLLYVCEPQEEPGGLAAGESRQASHCADQLQAFRAQAEQAGAARVSTVLVRGEAATEIIAEARRRQADFIIIGAHGHTGITRFLMGSTAEAVLRTAPCATLLLRDALTPRSDEQA
jgi:nucleotide-binding universal stress UspA family protein